MCTCIFLNFSEKKLCDIRVWYLNIITDGVFGIDLSDSQLELKNTIETNVLKSMENPQSAMVGCDVLEIYNNLLKDHFNYGSTNRHAMSTTDTYTKHEIVLDETVEIETKASADEKNVNDDFGDMNNPDEMNRKNAISRNIGDQCYIDGGLKDVFLQICTNHSMPFTYANTKEETNLFHDHLYGGIANDVTEESEHTVHNANTQTVGHLVPNDNVSKQKDDSKHSVIRKSWDMLIASFIWTNKHCLAEVTTESPDDHLDETDIEEDLDELLITERDKTKYHRPDEGMIKHTVAEKTNYRNSLSDSGQKMLGKCFVSVKQSQDTDVFFNIHKNDIEYVNDSVQNPSYSKSQGELSEDDEGKITIEANTNIDNDRSLLGNCDISSQDNDDLPDCDENHDSDHGSANIEPVKEILVKDTHRMDEFKLAVNKKPHLKRVDDGDSKLDLVKQGTNAETDFTYVKNVDVNTNINQEMEEQKKKVQSLEVMIMKLENKLLLDALNKQDYSTTITRLENHILRMENEMLKMSRDYQNLRRETQSMDERQNKYLKLMQNTNNPANLPEIEYFGTKCNEVIAKQDEKLEELAAVLQNQMLTINHLNERLNYLEQQSKMLHLTMMNQTLSISSVMQTIHHLSEQRTTNVVETARLNEIYKVSKFTNGANTVQNDRTIDTVLKNTISHLDDYVFNQHEAKIPVLDSNEGASFLIKEVEDQDFSKTLKDWCPKDKARCPLCYYNLYLISACVPYARHSWAKCTYSKCNSDTRSTQESENKPHIPNANGFEGKSPISEKLTREVPTHSQQSPDLHQHIDETEQDIIINTVENMSEIKTLNNKPDGESHNHKQNIKVSALDNSLMNKQVINHQTIDSEVLRNSIISQLQNEGREYTSSDQILEMVQPENIELLEQDADLGQNEGDTNLNNIMHIQAGNQKDMNENPLNEELPEDIADPRDQETDQVKLLIGVKPSDETTDYTQHAELTQIAEQSSDHKQTVSAAGTGLGNAGGLNHADFDQGTDTFVRFETDQGPKDSKRTSSETAEHENSDESDNIIDTGKVITDNTLDYMEQKTKDVSDQVANNTHNKNINDTPDQTGKRMDQEQNLSLNNKLNDSSQTPDSDNSENMMEVHIENKMARHSQDNDQPNEEQKVGTQESEVNSNSDIKDKQADNEKAKKHDLDVHQSNEDSVGVTKNETVTAKSSTPSGKGKATNDKQTVNNKTQDERKEKQRHKPRHLNAEKQKEPKGKFILQQLKYK